MVDRCGHACLCCQGGDGVSGVWGGCQRGDGVSGVWGAQEAAGAQQKHHRFALASLGWAL